MKNFAKIMIGLGGGLIATATGLCVKKIFSNKKKTEVEPEEEKIVEEDDIPNEDEEKGVKLVWNDNTSKPKIEELMNSYSSGVFEGGDEDKPDLKKLSAYSIISANDYVEAPEFDGYLKLTCSWYPDVKRLVDLRDFEIIVDLADAVGPDAAEALNNLTVDDELYCVNRKTMTCYEILPVSTKYEEDFAEDISKEG